MHSTRPQPHMWHWDSRGKTDSAKWCDKGVTILCIFSACISHIISHARFFFMQKVSLYILGCQEPSLWTCSGEPMNRLSLFDVLSQASRVYMSKKRILHDNSFCRSIKENIYQSNGLISIADVTTQVWNGFFSKLAGTTIPMAFSQPTPQKL